MKSQLSRVGCGAKNGKAECSNRVSQPQSAFCFARKTKSKVETAAAAAAAGQAEADRPAGGTPAGNVTMAWSDDLPAMTAKISAGLALRPQVFVTHPAELRVLRMMTSAELVRYAAEHGWRTVRRIGGRQIEFYSDVGANSGN